MKQFLTFFFLLLTIGLFAQPANDDCAGIIDLGTAPSCDSTLYNNIGAMESDIGADNFPTCFIGVPDRDVWFQFTATADFLDYRIEVIGCEDTDQGIQAMSNPQVAIYRGDCEFDGLQLLDCGSAMPGESSILIDLIGLTPNITYFLRINDWSSTATPNDGAFKLCVIEKPPINTIDQGSSNECSGVLTDSGGEFGDYGDNENFVYTICPSQPHECILFDMQYYNIELAADQIIFYDGPDNSSTQIGQINGSNFPDDILGNEGGVCYSVSASSGCLTVEFISDSGISFEGFLGSWQCTSDACPEPAEIVVDADQDVNQIVESVISGQTLISLVEVDCADGQVGTFNITDDTDLNMDKGLVLSSGSVLEIAQPGNAFASNIFCSTSCTDDDLNTLSLLYGNGADAEDACVVEMDVLAASEELTFEYVFGSEEYPEFTAPNDLFNDIFAFLVSGPGIVGDPNVANKLNVAVLPDGTFIQIQDVNHSVNWPYYRDNTQGLNIVYDGLTSDSIGVKKSLTARVPTQPCETYKLKFAIADRGDSSYDSGVFISKINSGTPEVSVDFQNGIDYLVEDCTDLPDDILIGFGNPLDAPQTFTIIIGGTATMGDDYELTIPNTVTFETGTEIFTFPISVVVDNIVEGTETIEISLARDFGCGQTIVSTVVVDIQDLLEVDVLNDIQDTTILCVSNGSIPLEVSGAQEYQWFPDSLFDDPTSSTPIITTDSSQWVYVQGTLGVCTDIDSIYINAIDVEVNIIPDVDNIDLCEGDSVLVTATNNVDDQNLIWTSFFNTFDDPSSPTQVIAEESGFGFDNATVTINIGGCTAQDNININWVNLDIPQLANDTLICQNSSVQLAEEVESFTTTYSWSPNEFLEPSNEVSGPIATPEETTTYTLISSAGDGDNMCMDTASITITVLPADVNIEPMDTLYICLGETATLTNTTTNNVIDLTWSPLNDLVEISPNEVEVTPMFSQYYYATLETPDCVVMDSVWVQVDSLPDLSIMADPEKDSYCEGEEVYLISPTYEPANFMVIDHNWLPNQPGAQTPDTFLNMVIIALEDFTYTRTTTVNACESTDTIFIEVTPVTSISIIPADTTVCQGEQVQFTIDGPPELTDFMWMPADNLSCTECPDPIATATGTITYQVEAEFEGCPVGAAATINVPSQFFQYTGPNPICPETAIQLNNFNVPGATYSWTSSDGSLTTNEPQPIVSPTQTTTYNLTASIGSCSFETSLTIEVLDNFTLTVEPTGTSCPGDPVVLTANVSPSSTVANITWTNTVTGEEVPGPIATVNPNLTATWQATADDGCFTNTADLLVEVYPSFDIAVDPELANATQGEPVTFMANATIGGVNFEWFNGNSSVGTGASFTTQSCIDQTYDVIGTDANGCSVAASATLNVDDLIVTATPSEGTAIAGEPFTFTASANASGLDFSWIDPTTGEVIGMGAELTISSCTTQQYIVEATDGECSATDTVTLNIDGLIVTASPSEGTAIAGEPFTFTASANATGLDFDWIDISTGEVVGMGMELTISSCDDQMYVVEATDGECSATDTVTLSIQDGFTVSPPVIFSENGDSIAYYDSLGMLIVLDTLYEGELVEMTVDILPANDNYTYIWLIGDVVVAETNDPSSGLVNLPEVGDDFISAPFSVEVINSDGCEGGSMIPFDILNNPVELPNVFTPNGDGTNDVLSLISIVPVEVLEFRVWNRWGDLVYENEDGAGSWDGTIKDKAAASDVYIYSVTYQIPGVDNPMYPLKGDVTLLR